MGINTTDHTLSNLARAVNRLSSIINLDEGLLVRGTGSITVPGSIATEPTLVDVRTSVQLLDNAVNGNSLNSTMQFYKDGGQVFVTEDTGTPANNLPLPVKITSTTGDINITAGDLNVQLSHNAANPDSTQIGDGTEILAINPDGSINTNTVVALATTGGNIVNTAVSNVTPAQIDATSHPCKYVTVTANENNTGWIRVAVGGVTANTGIVLYPAESYKFDDISDSNLIYVIAEINGEDVSANYVN